MYINFHKIDDFPEQGNVGEHRPIVMARPFDDPQSFPAFGKGVI